MLDRRNILFAAAVTAGAAETGAMAAAGAAISPPAGLARFGLRGDGTGDDGPALAAASAAGQLTLGAGRYRVASDTVLTRGATLLPGAVLIVDRATLTIGTSFEAPSRRQLFDCISGGRVVFANDTVLEGYPEWWGAKTGEPGFDCLPALRACLAACEFMRLAASDYYVQDTFRVDIPYRRIGGTGWFATGERQATRIVLAGPHAGTGTVMQVGPSQRPAGIGDHAFTVGIADLVLARTARCVPPPGGEEAAAAIGMAISYVIQCRIERVAAIEHSIGFYLHGCVYTKLIDCFTQRYNAGSSPTNDIMRGFYADGRVKTPWFTGGNASVYFERCNVTGHHPAHADPIGLKADGAFCDLFIDRLETANVPRGCVFDASGTPNADSGNIDVHIRSSILDGCSAVGLELRRGPAGMSIEVADLYVALAGDDALAAIAIVDGGGLVSITGGEVHGRAARGALWVANQSGVQVKGLRIRDNGRPVLLDRAYGCDVQIACNNPGVSAAQAAVVMADCHHIYLRPTVIGKPGAFPAGVELRGAGNRHNEVNCTAIDPRALAGGSAARTLVHDRAAIERPGLFGDGNIASGAMG